MLISEDIIQGNFRDNWLVFTMNEELRIISKDPIIIRWLKFFVHVLFCCYCDVYGHVRIDRVAKGIWQLYQKEPKKNVACQKKYIALVNNLLDSDLERPPIKTFRKDLFILRQRFANPSQQG